MWTYIQRSFWEIFQLQENLGSKADTVVKQRQNFPSSRSGAGKHVCTHAVPFAQIDLCTNVLMSTAHTSRTTHTHWPVASVAQFQMAHSPLMGCKPGMGGPCLGGSLCQYFEIQASPPRTLNRWWLLLTKMGPWFKYSVKLFSKCLFLLREWMNEWMCEWTCSPYINLPVFYMWKLSKFSG